MSNLNTNGGGFVMSDTTTVPPATTPATPPPTIPATIPAPGTATAPSTEAAPEGPIPIPVPIGTIVDYFPAAEVHPSLFANDDPPFAAIVCGGNDDGTVNLAVFNHNAILASEMWVAFGKPPPEEGEGGDGEGDGEIEESYCVVAGAK